MALLPIGLCVFGSVGFVAGLFGWLVDRHFTHRSGACLASALVLLLGLAGSIALLTPHATSIGWPLVSVAGISGFFFLLRSSLFLQVGLTLQRWLGNARAQWLFLLLSSPLLALLLRCMVTSDSLELPAVGRVKATRLVTDLGMPVMLREIVGKNEPTTEMVDKELWAIQQEELLRRVIQTADATAAYNCHGWIFSGGRYLISDADVEPILKHNGYQEVNEARPDDLIVYRDETGSIVHTGIVRVAEPSGVVLVEGKWGWMGRYLHAPESQAFSNRWSYYRTGRNGHLLRQQVDEMAQRN